MSPSQSTQWESTGKPDDPSSERQPDNFRDKEQIPLSTRATEGGVPACVTSDRDTEGINQFPWAASPWVSQNAFAAEVRVLSVRDASVTFIPATFVLSVKITATRILVAGDTRVSTPRVAFFRYLSKFCQWRQLFMSQACSYLPILCYGGLAHFLWQSTAQFYCCE